MKRKTKFGLATAIIGVALLTRGSIHIYSYKNEPAIGNDGKPVAGIEVPRTSRALEFDEHPNQAFIGIAVSGGGSRAANFAAAVFQDLDDLGFLEQATVISCVSGGCLPTALYGLQKGKPDWPSFRNLMGTNFLGRWFLELSYPHNIIRNLLTDWDRSDAMAAVFNDVFYHDATFKDLGEKGPRILINATQLGRFGVTFSADTFRALGSRLDTYPIAYAVMASGAFPGAFNNVTLANYTKIGRPPIQAYQREGVDHYWHLFDGGPTDNLGVGTILGMLDNAVASATDSHRQPKGCLLILVDAYPGMVDGMKLPALDRSDPRTWSDLIVDGNVIDATDTMLQNLRAATLWELRNHSGYTLAASAYWHYQMTVKLSEHRDIGVDCNVWHLALERLKSVAWSFNFTGDAKRFSDYYRSVREVASGVETNYRLTGLGCDSDVLQDALYDAAHILVRDDRESLDQVCGWFARMSLPTKACYAHPARMEPRAIPIHEKNGRMVCR